MTIALRLAIGSVRAWTRVYTWRLAGELKERRRQEIESEIWESRCGAHAERVLAAQMFIRLVVGMLDDVTWRIEGMNGRSRVGRRTIGIAVGFSAVLALLWLGLTADRIQPPQPPAAPDLVVRHRNYPPPPPPPPPLCNPPGIGKPFSPCTPLR